ncbi:MAG: hypothetical protein ACTHXO_06970 [Actinomycetaceae bacterium]
MIRRLLAALLAVLGVVAIVLAVLSATTWRESDELTATLPEEPGTPILLTEPGVLDMAGDEVTITLTADEGEDIWMMIAPTDRVLEWVGDASRTTVSGFETRTELAARTDGTEESVPHPSTSDLFRGAEEGTGELTVDWTAEEGRWSVFAVVDGSADAPNLTLTWPREVSTPYLVPGLITGGVLLLAALALLLWPSRRREEDAVLDGGAAPTRGSALDDGAGAAHDEPTQDRATRDRAAQDDVHHDDVTDDDLATRTATGAYGSAPAAGRPTTDPYAPELVAGASMAAAGTAGAAAAGRAGTSDDSAGATDDRPADVEPDAGAAVAVAGGPDDETEQIPVTDGVDVTPEAVDAALPADMAALAEREQAGEKLRRYERRVLDGARREAREDLRAGSDTQVREDIRSAGASRGAGILPYSPRADETRVGGGDDESSADVAVSGTDAGGSAASTAAASGHDPAAVTDQAAVSGHDPAAVADQAAESGSDQAVAEAEAAQADGRPLSRRERRALERRARLGAEPEHRSEREQQLEPEHFSENQSAAQPEQQPGAGHRTQTTSAPSSATDDEWRDLWGFGPRGATDPEETR